MLFVNTHLIYIIGYYEDGNFGIRIENILHVVEASTKHNFQNRKFCKFENLTLVPIKKSLINIAMLTMDEIVYLNTYHRRVREELSPLMQEYFPEAMDYLLRETEDIIP